MSSHNVRQGERKFNQPYNILRQRNKPVHLLKSEQRSRIWREALCRESFYGLRYQRNITTQLYRPSHRAHTHKTHNVSRVSHFGFINNETLTMCPRLHSHIYLKICFAFLSMNFYMPPNSTLLFFCCVVGGVVYKTDLIFSRSKT